jgi:hypothetical protein
LLPPLQTVALSNIAQLAGALTNLVFNLPRKNPFRPGPLIDYDLLLLVSDGHRSEKTRVVTPGSCWHYHRSLHACTRAWCCLSPLQFGPPIVAGSVGGANLNFFVPSVVTKSLVLLVVLPLTWRMMKKAKLLWCVCGLGRCGVEGLQWRRLQ